MAIALVQSTHGRTPSNPGTLGLLFPGGVVSGNLLIAMAAAYQTVILAAHLSDTLAGVWQRDVQNADGATFSVAALSAKAPSGGADTVTCNQGVASFLAMGTVEFSGAHASSWVGGVSAANGNSATPNPGAIVAVADGAAVAFMSHRSGTVTLTPPVGWTQLGENENTSANPYSFIWRTIVSGNSYDAPWAASGAVNWIAAQIQIVEAAGGGGGFVLPPPAMGGGMSNMTGGFSG